MPSLSNIEYIIILSTISLCIGSFLNVVIYRFPKMLNKAWLMESTNFLQEYLYKTKNNSNTTNYIINKLTTEQNNKYNLAVPRSKCTNCNNIIRWWQNIPVLSFILLKSKCFYCKKKISYRYPIIELTCMLLSILCFQQFGPSKILIPILIATWILLILFVIDLDHKLLPDELTYSLLWIGLLVSAAKLHNVSPIESIIAAAVGYISLWSFYWVHKLITNKEGMGYGDFKLFAAIGAWVGLQKLLIVILIASLAGSIITLVLIALKKHEASQTIAFGPYIASAGWLVLVFDSFIESYIYKYIF